jgi:hypothetical protein
MLPRALSFLGLTIPILAALAAGCGDSPAAPLPSPPKPTSIRATQVDGSDTSNAPSANSGASETSGEAAADAAPLPAAVQMLKGNALCHAPMNSDSTAGACYPDNIINACDLSLNGATFGPDASGEFAPGCHVNPDGSPPVCLPGGGGMKNSSCAGPSDCAAGHECVGAGVCRRYCCSGDSECSLNEFCDIQKMAQNPNVLVPVCVTKVSCVLLDNDICPPTEQCGVVREDGSTSCVALGNAMNGDSCEQDHCAKGYLCLGAEGARHCAKLCYKGIIGQCPAAESCVGALPLFLTPTVGVCQ